MSLCFDGAEQLDLYKYALVKRNNTSIASFYQVYFRFLYSKAIHRGTWYFYKQYRNVVCYIFEFR